MTTLSIIYALTGFHSFLKIWKWTLTIIVISFKLVILVLLIESLIRLVVSCSMRYNNSWLLLLFLSSLCTILSQDAWYLDLGVLALGYRSLWNHTSSILINLRSCTYLCITFFPGVSFHYLIWVGSHIGTSSCLLRNWLLLSRTLLLLCSRLLTHRVILRFLWMFCILEHVPSIMSPSP